VTDPNQRIDLAYRQATLRLVLATVRESTELYEHAIEQLIEEIGAPIDPRSIANAAIGYAATCQLLLHDDDRDAAAAEVEQELLTTLSS
jgi:hypothetical protein